MSGDADTPPVTEPGRVDELRERVQRAEYVVDPTRVADALLSRGFGALSLALRPLEDREVDAGGRPGLNGDGTPPPGAAPRDRSAGRPQGRP